MFDIIFDLAWQVDVLANFVVSEQSIPLYIRSTKGGTAGTIPPRSHSG